jgi:NAD(P)-dependent dehydrogenase (short-subunit alcohol dehydrogenase family)
MASLLVTGASRGLGAWLEPRGVTVASIAPGWTRTELGGPRAHHGVEEAVERVRALLERLTVEDTGSYWNYDGEHLPW